MPPQLVVVTCPEQDERSPRSTASIAFWSLSISIPHHFFAQCEQTRHVVILFRRSRAAIISLFACVDRRSVHIKLTEKGREVRDIVAALYHKHINTVEQVGGKQVKAIAS
jgi:hypothetical protein